MNIELQFTHSRFSGDAHGTRVQRWPGNAPTLPATLGSGIFWKDSEFGSDRFKRK